jgi:hypothetical protein
MNAITRKRQRSILILIEETPPDQASGRSRCPGTHADSLMSWRYCRDQGSSGLLVGTPPRSIACEPWACRSQCGDTASLMPALAAVRFTMPLTARSVSDPPLLRLAKTGSLTPASGGNFGLGLAHLAALAHNRQLHAILAGQHVSPGQGPNRARPSAAPQSGPRRQRSISRQASCEVQDAHRGMRHRNERH